MTWDISLGNVLVTAALIVVAWLAVRRIESRLAGVEAEIEELTRLAQESCRGKVSKR